MAFLQKLAATAGIGLLGAAVVTELRKPADQRSWHGTLGPVPYDLRPPTAEKFRSALWDPSNDRLLVPHPFGVGWTINFARLARRAGVGQPARPDTSSVGRDF